MPKNRIIFDKDFTLKNGKVGIGTSVLSTTLNVNGNANITESLGIGTTNTNGASLYVDGNAIITGVTTLSSLGGITTTGGDLYVNSDLYVDVINSRNDLTINNRVQINENLNVDGNITIGGTVAYINVDEIRVKDKEIVLGIVTGTNQQDISTDDTANHGGIAIASTVGSPLVDLQISGINTLPFTYKQIMWIKSGTMGAGTTDAWLFNYAVGIGSTQVKNGVRLAVGAAVTISDDSITASNFYGNLIGIANTSINVVGGIASVTQLQVNGISTFTNGPLLVGSGTSTGTATQRLQVTGDAYVSGNLGIGTTNPTSKLDVVGDGRYTGVVTAINFIGNLIGYASTSGLSTSVIGGIASVTQLQVTGISTFTNGPILVGTATSTGTATQRLQVTGGGYVSGNLGIGSTNPTSKLDVVGDGRYTGVVTATTFIGNLIGYASTSGLSTSVIGGIASVSQLQVNGISTFTNGPLLVGSGTSTGSQNQILQVTGNSYISGNLGIGTTNPTAKLDIIGDGRYTGVVTATNFIGNLIGYASTSGISTNVIGGIASVTQLQVTGISTFTNGPVLIGSATSTGTATQRLQVTGGGYVSDNLGIGTTNPTSKLHVIPTSTGIAGLFSGSTSSDMVRITQLGTGNALVVEDEANPDSTPFVITGIGSVGIGTTNPQYKLHVVGSFGATTKSFVIPHPTRPGMTLVHGTLEGPELSVYVRGSTKENIIYLPDYWVELVHEDTITVNLTSKNGKLHSVVNVSNHQIEIEAIDGQIDCYFMILAERKDVPKIEVEF